VLATQTPLAQWLPATHWQSAVQAEQLATFPVVGGGHWQVASQASRPELTQPQGVAPLFHPLSVTPGTAQ
jgi:hypothetical protein